MRQRVLAIFLIIAMTFSHAGVLYAQDAGSSDAVIEDSAEDSAGEPAEASEGAAADAEKPAAEDEESAASVEDPTEGAKPADHTNGAEGAEDAASVNDPANNAEGVEPTTGAEDPAEPTAEVEETEAEGEDPTEITEEEDAEDSDEILEDADLIEYTGRGGADNDALFAAYVERELGVDAGELSQADAQNGQSQGVKKSPKGSAVRLLTTNELAVYSALKRKFAQIAAGELASTEVTLPISTLGSNLTWDASALGVSTIVSNGRITSEAMDAAWSKAGFNLSKVMDALMADCPYELYWYDKTAGTRINGISYGAQKTNGKWKLTMKGSLHFYFSVAAEYAAGIYRVDTSVGQSIQTALENAAAVVESAAGLSDYDKLCAYKQYICNSVSYNKSAANGGYPYGNPWQLIWVFDGDSTTNVVCEGYSKAFKYLCDKTDFDDRIDCITVIGTMSVGSGNGNHMWNVVRMEDGENYLVDITNSEPTTVGASGALFMAGPSSSLINSSGKMSQATFRIPSTVRYTYDSDTLGTYEASQINLADHNYIRDQVYIRLRSDVPEETYLYTRKQVTASLDGEEIDPSALTVTSADTAIVRVLGSGKSGFYLQGMKTGRTEITVTAVDQYGTEVSDTKEIIVLDDKRSASVKYNIAFAGNGATSGKMSTVKNVGYRTKKTLTANAFKRKGYTFTGWNTAADGSGIQYANKATVVALTSRNKGTVKLYAQWKKINYTITYVPNGGTNSEENPATYTVTDAFSLRKATRTNYVFSGWYSDKKFKNRVTTIKKGTTGNKTYYAKWTPNKYKIVFVRNGATGGKMKDMTGIAFNATKTLTANAYTRKGYTFTGWNRDPEGYGEAYANKAKVNGLSTVNGDVIRLYAQWRLTNYRINYNVTSDVDNSMNPATYTILDETITLQRPVRTGYTFGGWYSDKKFKKRVTTIKQGSTGTKTLYPKWTANSYKIAFDGNGATSGSTKGISTSYGKTVTLTANGFKLGGYKFLGWSRDAEAETAEFKNKASVKNLTPVKGETVTLYAVWSRFTDQDYVSALIAYLKNKHKIYAWYDDSYDEGYPSMMDYDTFMYYYGDCYEDLTWQEGYGRLFVNIYKAQGEGVLPEFFMIDRDSGEVRRLDYEWGRYPARTFYLW